MMKYSLLLIAALISPPAWSLDNDKIVQGLENDAAYPFAYQRALQQNTYLAWRNVAAKYAQFDTQAKAFMQAWRQAQALNQESIYKDFLKIRPNSLLNLQAIHAIFELTKASNTIADYHRFMEEFPDAVESVEALFKIQALAFERAKQAHDPLVYDAFVTTFPGAKQIPEAIDLAFEAEKEAFEKEIKGWEEDFKNSYNGTTAVDTIISWMLEGKAGGFVSEAESALEKNNKLVAVRKYRLLALEIFKQTKTVTEELMRKTSREYDQWLESQQAELAKSINDIKYSLINDIKYSLVETIQRKTQHLESPLVDQDQKLEEVIASYNRFVAQQAEQFKQRVDKHETSFFERSLIMLYVSVPLSISNQRQQIKNAFENPTSQQVELLSLKESK